MEKYRPILETEKVKIYQKKDKTMIVSEKEFTFQTLTKIRKRPRNMVKKEPILEIKENKPLICNGCGQPIEIQKDEVGWYSVKDKNYHYECFNNGCKNCG